MNLKADKTALEKAIDDFSDQIQQLWGKSVDTFVDKNEMKKALRSFELQMKKLAVAMQNQKSVSPQREDAILAKKPLQGWSCGSCEKTLINLGGDPADFTSW